MTPAVPPSISAIASHLRCRVPRVRPDETVGAVRTSLIGSTFDTVTDLAVCEGERLVGLATIEAVLAAPADTTMASIMDADPPVVASDTDREPAAWKAVNHGEGSLAVVDADGRFIGLVPPHELLAILLAEHDEDVARISGYLHQAGEARSSATESVGRRLWHRLPWLLVGLAGALVAATLMSGSEDRLGATPTLAFFVPGLVYLADAVGTQTEALVIRGMAVGIQARSMLAREIGTGVLAGLILAVLAAPIVLVGWGEIDVALAVGVSLLGACSVATAVAVALPSVLRLTGSDPAFGSGPLATVVQDLLTLVIYLSVAAVLVT